MKLKIFIVAASMLFLSSISNSQTTTNYKGISVGIIGGVNIANIKFDPKPTTEPDSRTGLLAGAIVDIGISKNFAIMPGVEYIMKGYKVKTGVTGEVKLDYIEIPLLFKARFPGKTVTPYVAVGPTIGFRMSAKVKLDSLGTETDIKNDVKSSDFGLFFGAGADFKVAKTTSVFVQGGYSLGLTDINNTTSTTVVTKLKNYGIQATAGVKFSLK